MGGRFLPDESPLTPQPPTPASPTDQVQNLVNRGMSITNQGLAERTLTHVGFQRMSEYWQPFETAYTGAHGTLFAAGTNFSVILAQYLFDQRLRSHLMEAFSFIEVSIRTQWAQQLTHGFGHGDYAHQNPALFNKYHASNLTELQRSYQNITKNKGPSFHTQTIWDVTRAMSFGQLSKWYSNLKGRAVRQAISQTYGIEQSVLSSALNHLTAVRNISAHHDRLWNTTIATVLRIPTTLTKNKENASAFNPNALNKVYNALVMTTHLMEVIAPNGDWGKRLVTLKDNSQSRVPEALMGFPPNWKALDLWQKHL